MKGKYRENAAYADLIKSSRFNIIDIDSRAALSTNSVRFNAISQVVILILRLRERKSPIIYFADREML
jgi:hypothetical protein